MKHRTWKKAAGAVFTAALLCTSQLLQFPFGRENTAFAAGKTENQTGQQDTPAVIGAVLPESGAGASLDINAAGASLVDVTWSSYVNPVASGTDYTKNAAADPVIVKSWSELKKAVSDAGKTRTQIRIDADLRGDGVMLDIPKGSDITVDLNGHTIDHGRTSAYADGHIFHVIGTFTLTDCSARLGGKLTGGFANNGGAINVGVSAVTTVSHVIFENNKAADKGGAIQNYGTLTITDCIFRRCEANGYGGAVSNCRSDMNSNPTVTVKNCKFQLGFADIGGGGAYNTGTMTVDECYFRACSSLNQSEYNNGQEIYARGGALCNYSKMFVTGTTFYNCTSYCEGGAVWWGRQSDSIAAGGYLKDCKFTECISENNLNDGGAICGKEGTDLTVSDCLIEQCNARSGGGIWSKAKLTVTNTVVKNCSANSGGGIVAHRSSDLKNVTVQGCTAALVLTKNGDPSPSAKVTGCLIKDCKYTANNSSGGITSDGALTLKDTQITGCKSYSGGALWANGISVLNNVFIESCSAVYGGGISNHKEMTADRLTVKNCTGSTNGGAIHMAKLGTSTVKPTLTAKNCLLSGNSSATHGGGVYAENISSISFSGNNAIENNTAKTDGGGICLKDGTLSVSGGCISGNEAGGGGAGIWSNGTATVSGVTVSGNKNAINGGGLTNHGTMTITDCTVTDNSVSTAGGGIYLGQGGKALRLTGKTAVSGNTAKYGGGIYTANEYGGTLEVQGRIIVTGNLKHDIRLETGKLITVTGILESGTWIGICPNGDPVKVIRDYGRFCIKDPDTMFYVTDRGTALHISNTLDFNDVSCTSREEQNQNWQAEIWFTGRIAAKCQTAADAWSRAVSESKSRGRDETVTVKLMQDWIVSGSFPDSISADGALDVSGCNIGLDLNGHIVSRGLVKEQDNGQLFTVRDGAVLVISDSSPNSENYGFGVRGGILTGGHSDDFSGCIEICKGGTVYFNGGSIVSCHTDKAGSAVRMAEGGTLNVDGGSFISNMDTWDGGGAIYCNKGTLNLKNAVFEGNYSKDEGGAIYLENSVLSAKDCIFRSNKGEDHGGAVYITGGDSKVDFDGCVFIGCVSGEDGGAVYVNKCDHVYIHNSIFDGNLADDTGGAIHADYDNIVLDSVTVINNTAKQGGGIYVFAHKDIGMQGRMIVRGNHDREGKDNNVVLEWRTVTIKAYINNGGLYEGSEIHVKSDTSGTTRIGKNISMSQQQYFIADGGTTKLDKLEEKAEKFVSSVIGSGSLVIILVGLMVMILATAGVILFKKRSGRKQKAAGKGDVTA